MVMGEGAEVGGVSLSHGRRGRCCRMQEEVIEQPGQKDVQSASRHVLGVAVEV